MAKKKQSDLSPSSPTHQAGAARADNGETGREVLTNKLEGVRRAVRALGKDATPADILKFLKEHFDIDMTAKMVSSYKSLVLKQRAAKRQAARQTRDEPPRPQAPPRGDVSLEDIRTLKEVGDRLGPEQFRELIEILYP
jgi:hypothetical protein